MVASSLDTLEEANLMRLLIELQVTSVLITY